MSDDRESGTRVRLFTAAGPDTPGDDPHRAPDTDDGGSADDDLLRVALGIPVEEEPPPPRSGGADFARPVIRTRKPAPPTDKRRRGDVRRPSPLWRRTLLRSRVLSIAALGVLFVALASVIGSVAVSRMSDATDRVASLTDARRENASAADTLTALQQKPSDDLVRRQALAAARVEAAIGDVAALRAPLTKATAADHDYLATVRAASSDAAAKPNATRLDAASAARQELDSARSRRRRPRRATTCRPRGSGRWRR